MRRELANIAASRRKHSKPKLQTGFRRMAALEIPCPQCGRLLKLPDRSLLGRKGRCSKCGHKFLLQESVALGDLPARTPAGVGEEDQPRRGRGLPGWGSEPEASSAAERPSSSEFPAFDLVAESDTAVASRLHARRSSGRTMLVWVVVCLVVGAGGGAAAWFGGLLDSKVGQHQAKKGNKSSSKAAAGAPVEDAGDATTTKAKHQAKKDEPGQPLTLQLVPMGARIVVHLRVAELWEPGGRGEEFRACLGPLGVWIENQIKQQTLTVPAAIDELLFALIPSSQETFETTVVVRTREPVRRSEWIEKVGGELVDRPRPHYLTDDKIYLLQDAKTYAIAPRAMADSLLESVESGGITSDGIQALLPRTDRSRHVNLLCELDDVRAGQSWLVPESAHPLLEGILEFFGDHVETVAWSFSLGDSAHESPLKSELLVRNRPDRNSAKVLQDLEQRIAKLPASMLDLVYQTHPRKRGEKKLVGRFPIMLKVLEQSLSTTSSPKLASLSVELPERAGPNLALGALLTWNQTLQPDFGGSSARKPTSKPGVKPDLPATIAERLKKKIDVEFRDDFLYTAVAFIGEETGVEFKLDGPGMKLVGVTQNEKQKFAMTGAPATAVLYKILEPRKLVLVVDEQQKLATITSARVAEERKLPVFPLEPAGP